MDVCSQCGHELDLGRFCLNCGHPVSEGAPRGGAHARSHGGSRSARTDTAERPRVPASGPAPASTPTRYPLFADEADAHAETAPTPGPDPEPSPRRHVDETRRRGAAAGWVPWVAGLTVMMTLAALGLWLLLGGEEDPAATEPVSDPVRTEQPSRDPRTPQGRATVQPLPEAEPGDLAGAATVRAPRPAPPTQDITGSPVTFAAGNLLDGVPETCWRMPGDGTGQSITFSFDEPVEVSEVGLVNGYAKTASDASGTYDWYAGNRRTLQVEWTFDDGTILTQDLSETREMQTVGLEEDVVTEQVTVRLIEVTPPGTGPASRDFTALSEVRLLGRSA